jgi:small-conductance mechanosensitive channel
VRRAYPATRTRHLRMGIPIRWLVLGVILLAGTLAEIVAQNTAPTDPSSADIIQFLSQTIDWYRQIQQEQQIATEPADLGFVADNRRMATQIVRLAFDFAHQEEQRHSKQSRATSNATPSGNVSQNDSLNKAASAADQLVQQTQAELEALKKQLATVSAAKRRHLENQIAETESELGLFQARQQALHSMLDFASGASGAVGGTGLRAQIEELARAVPPAVSGMNGTDSTLPSDQESSAKLNSLSKPAPNGIWGLTTELFRLSSKRSVLTNELRATEALQSSSMQVREPLRKHLKDLIQSGNQLAQQADVSDQNALAQEKQQLDSVTTEFKQVSGLLISLRKQAILLDLYKRSLSNWKQEVDTEFKENLKGLLARIGGVAVALGVVLIIGEVWRRTIFRYVHDVRRRYQFLLMRKIAIWFGLALVLIFAFVTELGAVATFAGLITAGVAVALQNVIVSMVGYFFLIGRFGIRVGDRVQVGTVTGEVVDIGLVRFHLMELSGNTADSEPTGRVVAFSNSVVFQAAASLFKQIPGTNFVWHEIILKFAPESDYRTIRDRVQKAIDTAFSEYRDSLERQRRQMELSLTSISASELKPRARIHFTTSAIEVIVRYPLVMDKAVETDERIIGEIFSAVNDEPRLNLLNAEVPTAKAAT